MLIKVKVFPNSKKEEVIRKSEDSFQVKVREKPIQGQANRAVTEALASFLKLPENKIRLVRGFRTRNKLFALNQNKFDLGEPLNQSDVTSDDSGSKTK